MDIQAAKATSGGEDCGSLERPTHRNEHHGVSFFFIPYICVLSHHHSESDEHVSSPFKSAPYTRIYPGNPGIHTHKELSEVDVIIHYRENV